MNVTNRDGGRRGEERGGEGRRTKEGEKGRGEGERERRGEERGGEGRRGEERGRIGRRGGGEEGDCQDRPTVSKRER